MTRLAPAFPSPCAGAHHHDPPAPPFPSPCAGAKRLDAKRPSSSPSPSPSQPGGREDLFRELRRRRIPPPSQQEKARLQTTREAAREELHRSDIFEGFDEPTGSADKGAQAQAGWLGLGPVVSTDGSYDGGGIYTAFEDGQPDRAPAPSVPIVKEARN